MQMVLHFATQLTNYKDRRIKTIQRQRQAYLACTKDAVPIAKERTSWNARKCCFATRREGGSET